MNNEAFSKKEIKCSRTEEPKVTYLNNLNRISQEAKKQVNGKLLTHYSISWNWGRQCGSQKDNVVTWRGLRQKVNRHMIDIFDSIDTQVKDGNHSKVMFIRFLKYQMYP